MRLGSFTRQGETISAYRQGRRFSVQLLGQRLPVPETLSLLSNYEDTVMFLARLRAVLRRGFQKSSRRSRRSWSSIPQTVKDFWDFSKIKTMSPAVALIIASEYHTIAKIGGFMSAAFELEKWDRNVLAMLSQLGFFKMTGTDGLSQSIGSFDESVYMLPLHTGKRSDGASPILNVLSKMNLDVLNAHTDFYDAMVEAANNANEHAYKVTTEIQWPFIENWWMTGWIDKRKKAFRLMMYDQGITIPGSLPYSEKGAYLQELLKSVWNIVWSVGISDYDGEAIMAAMDLGASSTGEVTRGKGLPFLLKPLDYCDSGRLDIFSRRGHYAKVKGAPASHVTYRTAVGGTLVIWNLSFGGSHA